MDEPILAEDAGIEPAIPESNSGALPLGESSVLPVFPGCQLVT